MAWQMSRAKPPAMSPEDMDLYRRHINEQPEQEYLGRGTPSCCLPRYPPYESGGRYDLSHFWLYPLAAVPFMLLTRALGFADTYAFFALHLVLLVGVAAVVSRRTSPWAAAVVVLSPMLYWLDKPHSEIFVFAAIACAMCWWGDRPASGAIALALAASQNLALAPLLPLYVLAVLVRRGRRWISPRTIVALAVAGAIVLIHPGYYLVRIGVIDPQSLLDDQRFRIPSATKLFTPVIDPYLGLVAWWPGLLALLGLAGVVGIRQARSGHWRPSARSLLPTAVLLLMVLAALFGAAQNLNSNHGATFGMSRYATWIAPLALPALLVLHDRSTPASRYAVAPIAVASVALSLVVARPALPDVPSIFRPTVASRVLFRYAPSLYDPVPEVFIEREIAVATDDKVGRPAATGDCSKVLLHRGQWPGTCPRPAVIPPRCTGAPFCYASRSGSGYSYSTVAELS